MRFLGLLIFSLTSFFNEEFVIALAKSFEVPVGGVVNEFLARAFDVFGQK